MSICDNCKFKKNNYCIFFKSNTIISTKPTVCSGYKKKLDKPITNDIKKKSIKQEKRLAKDLGAKRTPKSGAIATSPSDMIKGQYVLESKATSKKSINLKKEWLAQLKQNPMLLDKIPVLIIEFSKEERFVILDFNDFQRIIE